MANHIPPTPLGFDHFPTLHDGYFLASTTTRTTSMVTPRHGPFAHIYFMVGLDNVPQFRTS
jgi:hypothetical protein